METCFKAKDGKVFESKQACREYEKYDMHREMKMEELRLLAIDTRLDRTTAECWIVINWSSIYDIMEKNKYIRIQERKEYWGQGD